MAKALDVAGSLLQVARLEEEPDYLTHLRLQKLLYYAQGWSLAIRNKPMFAERIEAWTHGPVVKDVYPSFVGHKDKPIDAMPENQEQLDLDESFFVKLVWESYKGYSASALREMTHRERPWIEARGGLPPSAPSNAEISQESLYKYFAEQSAVRPTVNFVAMPNWNSKARPAVIEAAQRVFAKHSNALRELAK